MEPIRALTRERCGGFPSRREWGHAHGMARLHFCVGFMVCVGCGSSDGGGARLASSTNDGGTLDGATSGETGGASASSGGATSASGGTSSGGTTSTGGASNGGTTSTGGASSNGGDTSTGGTTSTGGASSSGGTASTGGTASNGGASSGGANGAGGIGTDCFTSCRIGGHSDAECQALCPPPPPPTCATCSTYKCLTAGCTCVVTCCTSASQHLVCPANLGGICYCAAN